MKGNLKETLWTGVFALSLVGPMVSQVQAQEIKKCKTQNIQEDAKPTWVDEEEKVDESERTMKGVIELSCLLDTEEASGTLVTLAQDTFVPRLTGKESSPQVTVTAQGEPQGASQWETSELDQLKVELARGSELPYDALQVLALEDAKKYVLQEVDSSDDGGAVLQVTRRAYLGADTEALALISLTDSLQSNSTKLNVLKALNKGLYLGKLSEGQYRVDIKVYVEAQFPQEGSIQSHVKLLKKEVRKALQKETRSNGDGLFDLLKEKL